MRQVTAANGLNIPLIGITTKRKRTLAPTQDWVFVQLHDDTVTKSGIVIASTEDGSHTREATVTAVGPECKSSIKVGDVVKHIGRALDFIVDDETYYMLRDAMPQAGDVRQDQYGRPMGQPYIICVLRSEAIPS